MENNHPPPPPYFLCPPPLLPPLPQPLNYLQPRLYYTSHATTPPPPPPYFLHHLPSPPPFHYPQPFLVSQRSHLPPLPLYFSFSSPLYTMEAFDTQRSMALIQFMVAKGLVPLQEQEHKRKYAMKNLKQIVSSWIKEVAEKHKIAHTSATILTYGSYGLGVHTSESDIDALCVAPNFVSIDEGFFDVLHCRLQRRLEVSELQRVDSAIVPLMRFKFDGISIDLTFARLDLQQVPEDIDTQDPVFKWYFNDTQRKKRNIDDKSWKSLSGVRANMFILERVPNVEIFQSFVRCLKYWAKERGVYGAVHGFLGGVHLVVLAAYVCQRHTAAASLSCLIFKFFEIFAYWDWPKPVSLLKETCSTSVNGVDKSIFMPICLPITPFDYCTSSISKNTFVKIKGELMRGHTITKDIMHPNFSWDSLFEPFPYSKTYPHFLKIQLSARDHRELGDWGGWVKSRFPRFRSVVAKTGCFCDPNPTEHVDNNTREPNMVFYWGLDDVEDDSKIITSLQSKWETIVRLGYEGSPGKMELSILLASMLPKDC